MAFAMFAAACGEDPTPTPTPVPTATPTPLSEYDATLAAAMEEGTVSIIGHESELRRAIVKDEFEKRFPGITVEYLGLPGGEADARCESEWEAGVFNYDVVMARCVNFLFEIADDGGLQPIRDNVLLDNILEEDLWVGGFDESFLDTQDEYIFSFGAFSLSITWQRTDLLPQDEITRIEQLLDPKYAGRIGFADPRESFLSNYQAAFIFENSGEAGPAHAVRGQWLAHLRNGRPAHRHDGPYRRPLDGRWLPGPPPQVLPGRRPRSGEQHRADPVRERLLDGTDQRLRGHSNRQPPPQRHEDLDELGAGTRGPGALVVRLRRALGTGRTFLSELRAGGPTRRVVTGRTSRPKSSW